MNIYLERLAITIYIFVIIALVGLATIMLLFSLIVYLANKKFREEVNRKIKSYFCCLIRRGEEHPPLMLDEIFPL